MNKYLKRLASTAAILSLGFAGSACAHPHTKPTPQERVAVSAADLELGPALWKVADEDTTIYLFGTVHLLPDDTDWFSGQIKAALARSDTLVTEVDSSKAAASGNAMIAAGTLPAGSNLRDMLSADDKANYEAALKNLGVPVETFDSYEPWFASLQLSMLPLLMDGWSPASGVESVLHKEAGKDKESGALETAQFQIDMFDTMPQQTQINYLNQVVASLPEMKSTMDILLKEWTEGDAKAIGDLIGGTSDQESYKLVFSDRNANWAGWIDNRMDTPGTVFIAVGAGHLAGKDSVQDYLAARGIAVTRLQ